MRKFYSVLIPEESDIYSSFFIGTRAGIGFVSLRRCVLASRRSSAYSRPPLVIVAPFPQASFPY